MLLVIGLLLIGLVASVTLFILGTRAWNRVQERLEVADRIFKSRWE